MKLGVPRHLAFGVLVAAATILGSGAAAAQAATVAPPPGSTGGLYATLTPSVLTAVHNSGGVAVTSVTVGSTVSPWAKVAGAAATPTGGVLVYTWHNLNCFGSWTSVYAGVLTNGVIDARFLPFTSNDEADVSYRVHYKGDANYSAADGLCAGATFTKADPFMSFALHNAAHSSVASVAYGTLVHGLVHVTGPVDTPTGTVSISRFPSADCSGVATTVGPSALDAGGTLHSAAQWSFPAPGTYSFRAHYWGDTTYLAKNSGCITFTVTKATPNLTTALHGANHVLVPVALVGELIHASATLSSAVGTPTGTVTAKRYSDATCTLVENIVPIAAGPTMDPIGPTYTSPTPRTESWRLTYSGDANFNSVAGPCLVMTWRGTTTTAASLHDAAHHSITTVHVGSPVHLDAIVVGGFGSPTGDVTFWVSTSKDCDNPQPFDSPALSGGAVDDAGTAYVPPSAGTYSFEAVYGGSSTYASSTSPCQVLTVTAAPQPTAAPKPVATPGATPSVVPSGQPSVSAPPSSAPSGDPAPSAAPKASIDPTAAAGASNAPATSGPASTGDPAQPVAAADQSDSGLGIFLLIAVVLVLVGGLVASRWFRRSRPA